MKDKIYKPLIDKYFYYIWAPITILLAICTYISLFEVTSFFIMVSTDIFTFYFMISSLVGYCKFQEETLYIRFGFILKIEINYKDIIEIKKERGVMTYTMLSLKNALDHITIKYNKYDFIAISVKNQEDFIQELELRIKKAKERMINSI